jgi:hypothetical protein
VGGVGGVEPECLELSDGSTVGVMSLRRPLVERLRMTAAAMERAASADVATLAASGAHLFDGGVSERPHGHDAAREAAAELRELILAVQDLTAERDEARAALATERAAHASADEAAELGALRAENAKLRDENANMFTLLEENAALRTELEAARLQIDTSCHASVVDEEA